jgi:hypothetical protein
MRRPSSTISKQSKMSVSTRFSTIFIVFFGMKDQSAFGLTELDIKEESLLLSNDHLGSEMRLGSQNPYTVGTKDPMNSTTKREEELGLKNIKRKHGHSTLRPTKHGTMA